MSYIKRYLLCSWLFLLLNLPLFAQKNLLHQPVQFSQSSGTVEELLSALSRQSGIPFTYSPDLIELDRPIQLRGDEQSVGDYLNRILYNQPIRIRQRQGKILFLRDRKRGPQIHTVSGYVREVGSGEALISAAIVLPDQQTGVYTNDYGFFSLSLPEGTYRLRVAYLGYQEQWLDLKLDRNQFLKLELKAEFSLDAVEIVTTESQKRLPGISQHELSAEELASLPNLLGQQDMLKNIQLLPGVQSMSEGTNGLAVRGGNPDQNLILLDEVPIYNPSHSLGLFSVFYGDAIQKTRLIKGAFPASVGGRLSSVVDVRMKEGDLQRFHGEFSTGLLLGSFRLEGPIWKGKTSFHLSARRTLFDLLTNSIQITLRNNQGLSNYVNYHFADVNLKLNHQFSPTSRLYLSFYRGNDQFLNEDYGLGQQSPDDTSPDGINLLGWGNGLVSLRWNQVLKQKWFLNTTLHRSAYSYEYTNSRVIPVQRQDSSRFLQFGLYSGSQIQDVGAKVSLDYYPRPEHRFQFGLGGIRHEYEPYVAQLLEEGDSILRETPPDVSGEQVIAQEWFAYAQDDWELRPAWSLQAGLRLTSFGVEQASYLNLQPRLSLQWQPNAGNSLSASFSRMVQFVHLLTTQGVGLPSDLWVPSTERVRPQTALHWNVGYAHRWEAGYRLRLEGYYKQLRGLLDFQQDLSLQRVDTNDDWEELVAIGRGWSYGAEFQLEKTDGVFTGWLAYTLAWSYRQFEEINDGQRFPYRFDRRHDISLNLLYEPSPRREVGLVWMYGSGQPTSLGQERYPALFSNLPVILPGPRNAYRMAPYHRLDLSISFHKEKKRGRRTWVLGFYNLYNRQNPFYLLFRTELNNRPQLYQQSLLPILPYATYRFQF